MKNKTIKILIYLIVFTVATIYGYLENAGYINIRSLFNYDNKTEQIQKVNIEQTNNNLNYLGQFKVTKIVDGDTIHVSTTTGSTIIRFLAVNTPETSKTTARYICLGKMAKDYTERKLLGNEVYLWGDYTQPAKDKYNRTLAYLSLGTSTIFYNQELIETGLAKTYKANPPAVFYNQYLNLEEKVKKEKVGMWNKELCN